MNVYPMKINSIVFSPTPYKSSIFLFSYSACPKLSR